MIINDDALSALTTDGLPSGGSAVLKCNGITLLFTRGLVLYAMKTWTGSSNEWPGMVGPLGTGFAWHDWMGKRQALERLQRLLDVWAQTGAPIEYEITYT